MKGLGHNPDSSDKKGDWVWCLHCERVFKFDGKNHDCFYKDCDGGAADIFSWHKEGFVRGNHPEYPDEPELETSYPLYKKGA